jgi:hypothetical protein
MVADGVADVDDVLAGGLGAAGVTPTRLVEARRALDMFELAAPGVAELELLEVGVVPDAGALDEPAAALLPDNDGTAAAVCTLCRSRPRPERLPRNCGVIRDAKFSAPVAPLSRMVATRPPVATRALRTDRIAADAC